MRYCKLDLQRQHSAHGELDFLSYPENEYVFGVRF
jgi:hypothetical protein